MKIQLIDIGRDKINKIVEVISAEAALEEVSKYLRNSIVELQETENPDIYNVVVGGLRTVGQVKILNRLPVKKVYNQFNLPQHIVRHSPTGMSWGYGGSGPSDLALSLLTEAIGSEKAEKCYQDFKFEVVNLFSDRWSITTEQIQDWYIEYLTNKNNK
jgi:hypothetical protein